MDEQNHGNKYEQWKSITESDFVTLFIKTWFTFIAVLRELNPNVKVFTAEGKPRGDKPFLNAYKESVMPIVQKRISVDDIAQEMFRMYPLSMRKVIDVFPQFFFHTFFRINDDFKYGKREVSYRLDGMIRDRYEVHFHIVDKCRLKLSCGFSGIFRATTYNETIKKDIDLRPIIEKIVDKHRTQDQFIQEGQFIRDFYDGILAEVNETLNHYLFITLPTKSYCASINQRIQDNCLRLSNELNLELQKNYKLPHERSRYWNMNSYAIIYQRPFNRFGQVGSDEVYPREKEHYSRLLSTNGIDWFADFVYALRNALFHEIISPLDEEWQVIFKSAYLVLKQISDICIDTINRIAELSQDRYNVIFEYVFQHKNLLGDIDDSYELHGMSLKNWKIDNGNIVILVDFTLRKDQTGEAKQYEYQATLNDDFIIATVDQKDCVTISCIGAGNSNVQEGVNIG